MADRLLIAEYSKAGRPVVTDDVNAGYVVGDRLFDTTDKATWRCVDNSAGAAIWAAMTPPITQYTHAVTSQQVAPGVNTWYNLGGALITLPATGRGKYSLRASLDIELVLASNNGLSAIVEVMVSNSATPGAGSLAQGAAAGITINGSVMTHRFSVALNALPTLADNAILYVHVRYTNNVGAPTVNSFSLRATSSQIQLQHVTIQ